MPLLFSYSLNHQIWLWTFLQNWLYIFRQPDEYGILNHFWSLAVEEQFYLFWPFIILWMKKPKYLLVFMLLVLIIVFGLRLLIWLQQIESFPYYNIFTFTRIDGICIGSMIALLQRLSPRFLTKNVPWIVITFAVLNLLFDFINGYYNYSLPYLASAGYTTFALLFGLLVHEATLEKENWVKSIFSFPLLRFFGQISFGLYVFHWPLYVLLKPAMLQWLVVNGLSYVELVCSVLISLLAVLLSTLSYYFFERKFLAMKEKLA
jgi:peptidoglycan/LPS O-acetylase OafA/YrhL